MIPLLIFLALIILVIVVVTFAELHTYIYKLRGILPSKWFKNNNAQYNWIVVFSFLFAFGGLISFIWLFCIKDFALVLEKGATMASWGQVGDFIGGVGGTLFSLSGFLLLYISLASQRESSEKSQIEGRFLELVKLHRENTLEMEYHDPYSTKNNALGISTSEEKGRIVFKRIYYQVLLALDFVERFITEFENDPSKIYTQGTLIGLQTNANINERNVSVLELGKIDIAYSIVFNGISKESEAALKRQLLKFYQEDFIDPIISFFKIIPALGSDFYDGIQDIITNQNLLLPLVKELKIDPNITTIGERLEIKYPKSANFKYLDKVVQELGNFNKYFGGHQYKLGHYFRNFYQTVTYIDKSIALAYDDKYYYIKTLRAQLSTYEQYIFFFNSLSHLGRVWEYSYAAKNDANKHLITKYNLIKNISDLFLFESLNVTKYYPNVNFEFEDEPLGRQELIKKYL